MPLSQRTITEMATGAEALAKATGEAGMDAEYVAALLRTQQRANFLKELEGEGKCRVEHRTRPRTNDPGSGPSKQRIVHVGDNMFHDDAAELNGCWPSEVLIANVVLALAAGQGIGGQHGAKPERQIATYCGQVIHRDEARDTYWYVAESGRHETLTTEEYVELLQRQLR